LSYETASSGNAWRAGNLAFQRRLHPTTESSFLRQREGLHASDDDHPRAPRDVVRENGLLTRGYEFSSGVFGGVSTCGDSDGLRARAAAASSPRRALRREGRGRDRFAVRLRFGPASPSRSMHQTGNRLRKNAATIRGRSRREISARCLKYQACAPSDDS